MPTHRLFGSKAVADRDKDYAALSAAQAEERHMAPRCVTLQLDGRTKIICTPGLVERYRAHVAKQDIVTR